MLKVLAVCDKSGTAIDRLARGLSKYHTNLDYTVIAVHPKRPDNLEEFQELAKKADLIDWQYFRTAEMLRERYPWLKDKKQILVHYNPYSIKESNWNSYDAVVACNQSIYDDLDQLTSASLEYIPLTIDTDFWTFKREWKPELRVIMVANRIESKKGILEVAQACKQTGLKMLLVGAVSDPEYIHAVIQTGVVDFRPQVSDEDLREFYWTSLLHVCNSVDNFESGTLPILEAMLTGCPVLTREVGHVPELNNGENMFIHKGKPDDVEGLVKLLNKAVDDPESLKRIRERGWDTAKTRSNERRAYLYQKLYRQVMWPDSKPVSVVMPVYGECNLDSANAVLDQDYENLELILCNDDPRMRGVKPVSNDSRLIRVIDEPSKGYGLAKQRNLGVIEATGEIIVFCDQRMVMDKNAVSEFVKNLAPKRWVYGNKGFKKEWVENFSAVYRKDLINIGMFSERINEYGGMSQYMRSVAKINSFKLDYIETAKATPQGQSKNKYTKRPEIIRMKSKLWKMDLQL